MLAHMEGTNPDGSPREFEITFVVGTGPAIGRLSTKLCRKLGTAAHSNHKERGTLPLYDVRQKRPCSPFLYNITHYNGLKVWA